MEHMAQVNLHIGNNLCRLQNKYFVKYFLEEMNFDLKEDEAKVCPIYSYLLYPILSTHLNQSEIVPLKGCIKIKLRDKNSIIMFIF